MNRFAARRSENQTIDLRPMHCVAVEEARLPIHQIGDASVDIGRKPNGPAATGAFGIVRPPLSGRTSLAPPTGDAFDRVLDRKRLPLPIKIAVTQSQIFARPQPGGKGDEQNETVRHKRGSGDKAPRFIRRKDFEFTALDARKGQVRCRVLGNQLPCPRLLKRGVQNRMGVADGPWRQLGAKQSGVDRLQVERIQIAQPGFADRRQRISAEMAAIIVGSFVTQARLHRDRQPIFHVVGQAGFRLRALGDEGKLAEEFLFGRLARSRDGGVLIGAF